MSITKLACLGGFLLATFTSWAQLRPVHLCCDCREQPLAVEPTALRLSWTLESVDPKARGLQQTAYQILVASQSDRLAPGQADLWDSGRVPSDQMAQVAYAGKPLASYQRCWWTVRVWDQDGRASEWSRSAQWSMGLLAPADWQAKWISAGTGGEKSGPLPRFRREFTLDQANLKKGLKRATVSVCGLGFCELSLNGRKVGNQELDPGWTNYRKRCLYTTHDVTHDLQNASGERRLTLGLMLGNGMYNVRGGRYAKFIGSFGRPTFILQMHVEFGDGTTTNLVSDSSWKTAPGPITFSCIYGGEDYDARLAQPGWDRNGFDDSTWQPVRVEQGPGGRLVSQGAPPIRVMDSFAPVKITEPKPNVFVYDLGQNMSGWPLLEVRGPAGSTVRLIPGELLDPQGLVSQRSSGGPVSFNYTLSGAKTASGAVPLPESAQAYSTEHWQPRFSYSGFRYIQVGGAVPSSRSSGGSDQPIILNLQGQFVHSSARRIGTFACSEMLLNNIDHLICAAIESNLQSVLTDCPHREKLGWLEVSHLLGPAILFNYDAPLLYRKICDDTADSQLPNGLVPDIAPEYTVFSDGFRDSPEWGSACVINPWLVHQRYGDRQLLKDQYNTMVRYVTYLGSRAVDHIVSHGLGDWYDIGPKPPGESQLTSKGVTATAIYYLDIEILRRVADLLGKTDDAAKWAALGAEVRSAFNGRFFNSGTSEYDRGSQTANAMALVVGLAEPDRAAAVLERLVQDVRSRGNQVTAGDVGFRFLVEALRTGGRSDVLFDLVTRLQGPGYSDQLRKGATTLTEAWDADPASSQNHCMLGHVEEWFYTGLAGINPDPAATGFRKIIIKPQVVGGTRWVRASYDSVSGRIDSAWNRANDQLTLEVTLPPNTSATVYIPTTEPSRASEGGQPIAAAAGVKWLRAEEGSAVCEMGSGRYSFSAPLPHR